MQISKKYILGLLLITLFNALSYLYVYISNIVTHETDPIGFLLPFFLTYPLIFIALIISIRLASDYIRKSKIEKSSQKFKIYTVFILAYCIVTALNMLLVVFVPFGPILLAAGFALFYFLNKKSIKIA